MNELKDFAKLTSLDTGEMVFLSIKSEYRTFGANWKEAGVAGASPQPLEFQGTKPEERTIHFELDNIKTDRITLSIEEQIKLLEKLGHSVQGKARVHSLLYSYQANTFRCVLKSWQIKNEKGGILVLKSSR